MTGKSTRDENIFEKVLDFRVNIYYDLCVNKRKEDDKVSPRTGRPTTNPKKSEIKVRATKEDKEKLVYCCEKTGMTQYEVVMQGIDKVYNEIRATDALDK